MSNKLLDNVSKTLYRATLSDPRQRSAQPRELVRGRPAPRAETTSDTTRFRGLLIATLTGSLVAGLMALLLPPAGGHSSPGPLSRPHVQAKLECATCHVDQAPEDAKPKKTAGLPLNKVCTGCHGIHESTRPGHQRMRAAGAMPCYGCHPIHRSDQGVVFNPEGNPIRFAPGVEVETDPVAFRPTQKTTVAIVTAGSCKRCHDLDAPRDPIARCLVVGQESLGDARPVVCFDEHQVTFPDFDRQKRESGVCSAQHTADRALAWDGAREIAALLPLVPATSIAAAAAPTRTWTWIGAGLLAAGFAFTAVRTGHQLRARRKAKLAVPPTDTLVRPAARIRLPQIDTNTCLGCYACVDACPYDVLSIERYVAFVARPEACCGLTLCEQRCPNGSLKITDGDPIGDHPRLNDSLESNDVPGLYLAGDITGLPLIKNAIHQGAYAITQIEKAFKASGHKWGGKGEVMDVVIVGAGPAGISAALRAKELGFSFQVIEQGNVAQSIQSFPRGKLVFDQPLELPVTGKLWLKESTKEELLSHWMRIVRHEQLPILQDTRMVSLHKDGDIFVITTEPREGGPQTQRNARIVLLAVGQRGSPRRLPFDLSPDVESHVHYHLADARSFAGKRILVVGLGDVAMETAVALARQPDTHVTIAYRGKEFHRGKTRNIEEVRRMVVTSRITLLYETQVTGLATRGQEGSQSVMASLASPTGTRDHRCHAVMVMIGSIQPWNLLRQAGVRPTIEPSTAQSGPS